MQPISNVNRKMLTPNALENIGINDEKSLKNHGQVYLFFIGDPASILENVF